MIKKNRKERKFGVRPLVIGGASILVIILFATYFFNGGMLSYKEYPYNELIMEDDLYGSSEKAGWHKIKLGSFSIETPAAYRYFRLRGIDSYIGGITDLTDTLIFDYGWYSNDLSEFDSSRTYQVKYEGINGLNVKIVRPLSDSGSIGAYTDDLPGPDMFSIFCKNCHNIEEKIQMLRTLNFK